MTRSRVLLIDDRVAARRTVKSILAGFDCEFAEAADGEAALDLIAKTRFDVIFLDLQLPDISGIEILRRARERNQPLGPVIVLTGYLEPEAKEEIGRLGAFRHLTKDPINHAEVRVAFAAALPGTIAPATVAADSAAERSPREPKPRVRTRAARGGRHDPRPRILVLDDDPYWLDTISRVLGDDFAVTTTPDPEEACRVARRSHFDLVILDMNLPGGVSGLDILSRMAATHPSLNAIILTGEPGEGYDAAVESARRGARTFLVKSQLATLPQRVREILDGPMVAPRVFLSYDRDDQEPVMRLFRRLKQRGVRPWIDVVDLIVGTEFDPEIEAVIRKSQHFVFCYSQHSWNKEGTLRRELNLAIARLQELREDRHYLIVARLDRTEVVGPLRKYHYVDLFAPGGFEKLMQAICADAKPRE